MPSNLIINFTNLNHKNILIYLKILTDTYCHLPAYIHFKFATKNVENFLIIMRLQLEKGIIVNTCHWTTKKNLKKGRHVFQDYIMVHGKW